MTTVNIWKDAGLPHVRDVAEHADGVVRHTQVWINPVPICETKRNKIF